MRKFVIKLNAFDLLYWVNGETVSHNSHEQMVARSTIANLMDLYNHWCADQNDCAVCARPEAIFVYNQIGDIVYHPDAIEHSDRKFGELAARFKSAGIDMSMLYSAFVDAASHTVIRSTAHQGTIDDFGNMRYARRSGLAVLGSKNPIVMQSDTFGATGYDTNISITLFIDNEVETDIDIKTSLITAEMVNFVNGALTNTRVGDMEIPTSVERLEEEVLALGSERDDEREAVSIERHVITNAAKSHPVLGRMATSNAFWVVTSEGDGRSLNEAMRDMLASDGNPTLTTEEAITLASIVFSKRGVERSISA